MRQAVDKTGNDRREGTGHVRSRQAFARKQHGEKTCNYQVISSRHTLATRCVVVLFPQLKSKGINCLLVLYGGQPLDGDTITNLTFR